MSVSNWGELGRFRPAAGRLLLATPLLADSNFERSVVFVLEHDEDGTLGVIVNRPSHTPVGQVLPLWHDVVSDPTVVFAGGPVQPDGALCLGRLRAVDRKPLATGVREVAVRAVVDGVGTVDLDSNAGVAAQVTSRLRIFAGHSGWGAGQLDAEIAAGDWWVFDQGVSELFSDEPQTMWRRVLRRQPPPLNLVSTYPHDPLLN